MIWKGSGINLLWFHPGNPAQQRPELIGAHGRIIVRVAYPASSLRLCRIEFSVHARLHPRPRNSSVALGLGPGAGSGRAPRDPVEHCDHVLDLGAIEPLRDKHDLAAAVGIWPVVKPRQVV